MKYGESRARSIVKSLTFRFLATVVTFLVVWVITKELTLSLIVGLWETITKLLLYYFHERGWDYIKWGKKVALLKK